MISHLRCSLVLILLLLGAAPAKPAHSHPKKIVLVAGKKSHGPGHHEYEKGARLLAACLQNSPNLPPLKVEVHTDGWPRDEKTFDDADTILFFCDGSDHDERDHPLLVPGRLATIERQMKRGCGLVALHYTIFVPNEKGGRQFLDWIGGYFDYQSGPGERHWFSKIATHKTKPRPGTPSHPICRGLPEFDLEEEYYYNLRFAPPPAQVTPILVTDIPGEPMPQVVAYCRERPDGGRGFGFSGGHFHSNWQVENYRRMVLNALLWTAHLEVPAGGVQSTLPSADQITAQITAGDNKPIKTVIITGHQHPAHAWRDTTPAIREALAAADPRFQVRVVEDPEFLASDELRAVDLVVLNYCNWQQPGLSRKAQDNFVNYLQNGGGLSIVHFSNGAFHFSLPETPNTDWPEYRTKICRRVWDHTPEKSGHDAFGPFHVDITDRDHEITRGSAGYDTVDELYFRQQGTEPIHVLAVAHSKVTGQDEPMAFVYDYGRGRVFQTVLGHDAASIRSPGTAALLRRGSTWAARRDQIAAVPAAPAETKTMPAAPRDPARDAKFAGALDGMKSRGTVAERVEYRQLPLTVECRAKLRSKAGFNLLVANGPKESNAHWEVYSIAGSGNFSAYLPGFMPDVIDSGVPITDDQWHDLAMQYEPTRVRLYVDGRQVGDRELAPRGGQLQAGPLWFASYPPGGMGCDGAVDEVRISRGIRDVSKLAPGPFVPDETTIGLWHLDDAAGKECADASPLKNTAKIEPLAAVAPKPLSDATVPPAGTTDVAAVDPALEVVLLDHSPTESFLAVKADSQGRLFVGGREALFVYEPNDHGGYQPRRELFRFPADAWLFDVEIRGDDLYVMTSSSLYLLPGARLKREGIAPQRLIWGIPVDIHISFHALAWGPEGDLYFTAGDPLLNYGDYNRADHSGHWTLYSQPVGTKTEYTGVGGVFRCRPDGSNLRVVATGLRGPGGLVFDHDWNLFTNDNDHESLPQHYVPARLLHATPQADFSWPRGWMAEKTPDRKELLQTMFTGMGREVPIGQTYYDEPYLPESYRHNLLVAEWGRLAVARYELKARGASFAALNERFLLSGKTHARPVGVGVGRGGRIFASIAYMAHNEGSPVYPSDLVMIARRDDAPGRPFPAYDASTVPAEKLWQELGEASWERRSRAHQEILRRGGALLDEAAARLRTIDPTAPIAKHLLWLAAAGDTKPTQAQLVSFAGDLQSPLRLQALRALAQSSGAAADEIIFRQALVDSDPAVQLAALAAYFELPEVPIDLIATGPARSEDTYVRQTAVHVLARRGNVDQLARPYAKDVPTRLAGVLAVGTRLTVPPAFGPVPESLPLTYSSGNAFFDLQYVGEKIDLRKLARVGSFTMAEWWKVVPHTAEQEKLFTDLQEALKDSDPIVRSQAAYYLYILNDSRTEAQVAEVVAAAAEQRLAKVDHPAVQQVWIAGPFASNLRNATQTPELGAVDLSAEYATSAGAVQWQTLNAAPDGLFKLPEADKKVGEDTYYAYCRLHSGVPQRVRFIVSSSSAIKVWQNGAAVYENAVVAGKHRFANTVLLQLEPGSNDLLIRLRDLRDAVGGDFSFELKYSALPTVSAILPEKLGLATLAERLKEAGAADQSAIPPAFLTVDWSHAARDGDPVRGRKLFGADALGCVKCHAIAPGQASGGGPSLAEAAKRFTPAHLVESVLMPSKQIAPVFQATQIVTTGGRVETGLVVGETAERIDLLLPNATKKSIAKADIDERQPSQTSAMPAGLVKTPDELRDVLAYLLSENPEAP